MFCVTTFQINYILYYYLVYNHHLCIINFIYYNTLYIIYCNIQANYHNITGSSPVGGATKKQVN